MNAVGVGLRAARFGATMDRSRDSPPEAHRISGGQSRLSEDDHVTYTESAMHAWFENLWNKGDETTIDTMLHVDGVVHGLPTPDGQPIRGPEAFKPFYR